MHQALGSKSFLPAQVVPSPAIRGQVSFSSCQGCWSIGVWVGCPPFTTPVPLKTLGITEVLVDSSLYEKMIKIKEPGCLFRSPATLHFLTE